MIVDKSTVSAFVEYLYFSFYYIGSLFHSLGIRPVIAKTNKPSSEKNDGRSKVQRIEDCLGRLNSVDLWELRELALSDGGLLNGKFHTLHDGHFRSCQLSTVLTTLSFPFFYFSVSCFELLPNINKYSPISTTSMAEAGWVGRGRHSRPCAFHYRYRFSNVD